MVDPELGQVNKPPISKQAMKWRGMLRSNDATLEVQQHGQRWQIPNEAWGHKYLPKQTQGWSTLRVHHEGTPSLRKIFASPQWILAFEGIRKNPEKYLRPGCYIAFLDASLFIEEGLRKTTEKSFCSIVYGILSEEQALTHLSKDVPDTVNDELKSQRETPQPNYCAK